jgi:hypothetical protein
MMKDEDSESSQPITTKYETIREKKFEFPVEGPIRARLYSQYDCIPPEINIQVFYSLERYIEILFNFI